MSPLATQQQALLDALFAWPAQDAMKMIAACAIDPGARGLKAYQTNGHMLAERALTAAYPVVAQLVGQESFGDLARALWHAHPPRCGDMAQWGAELEGFVRNNPQLRDEEYLPDVARSEWALHGCATAADAVVDLSTLVLLTTHEPEAVYLRLAPGCSWVSSRWPVVSILTAHLEQTPSMAEVGRQMREAVAQNAVVWRAGLRPCVRVAMSGEPEFLNALTQGESLSQALDTAGTLDFGQWLPLAAQTGLLLSVGITCGP